MRVLHFGFGGQMIIMSDALKQINIMAKSCHMMKSPHKFKPDICFEQKKCSKDELKQILEDASKNYDVFHFHFGRTFMYDRSDLPYLKNLGKKLIVQHRGSDVRRLSIARQFNNPYVLIKKQFAIEKKRIEMLKGLSSHIDHAIVADHELSPYVKDFYKKVHIVPQAINLVEFKPAFPTNNNKKPLIVHSPTHFQIKGTKHVIKAIKQLKKEGYIFNFQLLSDVPHEEALTIYRKADIIIDQLLIGSFGVFSLEAMALGKPVICFIREDLVNKYPHDLPIINSNPDTIYSTLKSLLSNSKDIYQLGVKGRNYVEKYHNSRVIAEQLKNIYLEL